VGGVLLIITGDRRDDDGHEPGAELWRVPFAGWGQLHELRAATWCVPRRYTVVDLERDRVPGRRLLERPDHAAGRGGQDPRGRRRHGRESSALDNPHRSSRAAITRARCSSSAGQTTPAVVGIDHGRSRARRARLAQGLVLGPALDGRGGQGAHRRRYEWATRRASVTLEPTRRRRKTRSEKGDGATDAPVCHRTRIQPLPNSDHASRARPALGSQRHPRSPV
jgi:hypothetical protein